MDEYRCREVIQAVLEAISPFLFGGETVMLSVEAALHMQDPRLVAIAHACPPEMRASLRFRSGKGMGYSKHAGQKEKNNAEAKKVALPKNQAKQHAPSGVAGRVDDYLTQTKTPHTSGQLATALKFSTKQVQNALITLKGSKRVVSKPITNPAQFGPRVTYQAPEKN